jgi:hypothetical protein
LQIAQQAGKSPLKSWRGAQADFPMSGIDDHSDPRRRPGAAPKSVEAGAAMEHERLENEVQNDIGREGRVTGAKLSNFKNELLGVRPFLHDDPRDRPRWIFAGATTLHIDRQGSCNILLPVIPPR